MGITDKFGSSWTQGMGKMPELNLAKYAPYTGEKNISLDSSIKIIINYEKGEITDITDDEAYCDSEQGLRFTYNIKDNTFTKYIYVYPKTDPSGEENMSKDEIIKFKNKLKQALKTNTSELVNKTLPAIIKKVEEYLKKLK